MPDRLDSALDKEFEVISPEAAFDDVDDWTEIERLAAPGPRLLPPHRSAQTTKLNFEGCFLARRGMKDMSVERTAVETYATPAPLPSKWYAKGVSKEHEGTRSEWSAENCGAEVVRKQPDGSWLFVIDNPYAGTSWDSFPEY